MRIRLRQERRRHRVGRHVTTPRSTDAVRRVRAATVVAVATLGLVVAAAVMPVQSTLASFTDGESATSAPLTAATLPTVNNLKCDASGVLAPGLELDWASLTAGTIAATGYVVTLTNSAGKIVISKNVSGTATTMRLSVSELGLLGDGAYTVKVVAALSSAPNWRSVGGDTAVYTRALLGLLKTCS